MSFKAQLDLALGWKWDSGAVDDDSLRYAEYLLQGADLNQADAVWHSEERSLADGTSETFDLEALTRTVLGDTLTTRLSKIKALMIVNLSAAGDLLVGDALVNEWTAPFGREGDRVRVPPDSALVLSSRRNGFSVGPGPHDSSSSSSSSGETSSDSNLKIEASGGTIVYSIAIVGVAWTSAESSSSSGA